MLNIVITSQTNVDLTLRRPLDVHLPKSTRSVTELRCTPTMLAGGGRPERAALVAGAAEGLRRRVGLRAWPTLRRGEAELGAQVRGVLGAGRFDEVFAAGSRLTQREAVAAVGDQRGAGTRAS